MYCIFGGARSLFSLFSHLFFLSLKNILYRLRRQYFLLKWLTSQYDILSIFYLFGNQKLWSYIWFSWPLSLVPWYNQGWSPRVYFKSQLFSFWFDHSFFLVHSIKFCSIDYYSNFRLKLNRWLPIRYGLSFVCQRINRSIVNWWN